MKPNSAIVFPSSTVKSDNSTSQESRKLRSHSTGDASIGALTCYVINGSNERFTYGVTAPPTEICSQAGSHRTSKDLLDPNQADKHGDKLTRSRSYRYTFRT